MLRCRHSPIHARSARALLFCDASFQHVATVFPSCCCVSLPAARGELLLRTGRSSGSDRTNPAFAPGCSVRESANATEHVGICGAVHSA